MKAKIAKDNKTKRKYIENLWINTFNKLDTSGTNTEFYKKMFKGMSDAQFFKMIESLEKDDIYPYLEIDEFDRTPTTDDVEKAAKVVNIPLFERVIYYDEDLKDYAATKYPVPVGYTHLRRVAQMVVKKNGVTDNIDIRNAKTGQVTSDSKVARDSDMENYNLTVLEADNILKEFLGPLSDDMVGKRELYNNISRDGVGYLKDLPNDLANKTTLNTLDRYFISAGLKTDLVTPGLVLRSTIDGRAGKDSTRSSIKKTTV